MTPTSPSVSVVVSTFSESRWDQLLLAIHSLRQQTVLPSEIIVVVDHNPELFRRARAHKGEFLVVENSDPAGLAGARNSGVAAASSEIVAFIDDDAEALPDWLENLLPVYLDKRVLGAGGAIEPVWPQRPGWFPAELDWVVGCSYLGLPGSAAPVRNLIGCNMSFRRRALAESGGFRNGIGRVGALPLGCEETELCIRLRQRWPDRELLYEPLARVRHRIPVERGRWRYLAERCYAEGRSKAQVAAAVGGRDGLSSERSYVLRTLPSGVVRGLKDFALGLQPGGLGRSAAILSGLVLATVGYCHGRLISRGDRLPHGKGQRMDEASADGPRPAHEHSYIPSRTEPDDRRGRGP